MLRAGGKAYEGFVWACPRPIPVILKIENLLCNYNEKVDLHVDGVLQEACLAFLLDRPD